MQDNINGLGEMAGRNTTSCWDTFSRRGAVKESVCVFPEVSPD